MSFLEELLLKYDVLQFITSLTLANNTAIIYTIAISIMVLDNLFDWNFNKICNSWKIRFSGQRLQLRVLNPWCHRIWSNMIHYTTNDTLSMANVSDEQCGIKTALDDINWIRCLQKWFSYSTCVDITRKPHVCNLFSMFANRRGNLFISFNVYA